MHSEPFTYELPADGGIPSAYDSHISRRLSAMRGMYCDEAAFAALLARDDALLYEVYEIQRPHAPGELLQGVSVVHPGKVGDEYYMTKGHFHEVLDTGEVYYCLSGAGMMVMETPEGESSVQPFRAGQVLYVLPRWAHRSVNTSPDQALVFYFVYPGNAGHNYGTIEQQGFRKLVVERDGQPTVIDNPRWKQA
jgi:glucose-6-phosphate isomerase